jgi:hypothetical protein
MKLLRNITAIILLGAVMLPLLTASFLQVKQLVVQWHMRESLEHEQLTTISVKTNAIHWIKKNKECLIDGELFDVKKMQVANEETLLTGLYDTAEKTIHQQLAKQSKQQQEPGHSSQLIKLLLQVNSTVQTIEYFFQPQGIFVPYGTYTQTIYLLPYTGHNTPPPKYC